MSEDRRQRSDVRFFCFLLCAFCFLTTAFYPLFSFAQEEIIPVIKFKDADIKVVLQSIAQKAVKDGRKVNIVISPKVEGLVTVDLESVNWQTALKGVLNAYGYSYRWAGENIILVATIDEIKEREVQDKERQEIEVPKIKIFKLKYIDANDAKKTITPLLSPVGKVSVLEATGQAGWEFGDDFAKRKRAEQGQISRTKSLIVSDVSKSLEEIEKLLVEVDIMPKQVLIKVKIMEVDKDVLDDIGFEWGTGKGGAGGVSFDQLDVNGKNTKNLGGRMWTGVDPSVLTDGGLNTAKEGLKIDFKSITGSQFEVIMHALEKDKRAITLSAPSILTLNNQEASILVGSKFPIVKTQVSEQSNQIIGGSLEKYQDIGIQLNVVPQICGEEENYVNMILHPVVSTKTGTVDIKTTADPPTILAQYPMLEVREAQTQAVVKDGETIVLGGLLKDAKSKEYRGIPVLDKLPFFGSLFRREGDNRSKIDLLIFITAHVIRQGEVLPQEAINITPVTSKFKRKQNVY